MESAVAGIAAAVELGIEDLAVRMDSELVVRQLTGIYRVKHPDLIPLHERARGLLRSFKSVDIQHIPRAKNKAADALVNAALDAAAAQRALDRTVGVRVSRMSVFVAVALVIAVIGMWQLFARTESGRYEAARKVAAVALGDPHRHGDRPRQGPDRARVVRHRATSTACRSSATA